MKKMFSILLAIILLLCSFVNSYASESCKEYRDLASVEMQVENIDDGHELIRYGDVTIDDITTTEYRQIITQVGGDTSKYYEDFDTGIATVSLNGEIIETYNMNELRADYSVWSIPERDLKLIEDYWHEHINTGRSTSLKSLPSELVGKYSLVYSEEGSPVIQPVSSDASYSTRAATIIRPAGSVTAQYPMYYYNQVSEKRVYSSACSHYLDMSIKDSMYGYTQISKKSYTYQAGTLLSTIAGALKIASSTLLSSLTGFVTTTSGVLKLTSSINYYFSEEYSFSALRQVYIFDYTYNNRDVSIRTEYGNGKISMGWDFINNEYKNPRYIITALAYPHTLAYNTLYAKAQLSWEENIEDYGYWIWGDV